ncbi:MAG: GntR family transcriptional regulator, partial [Firmicutes bacterium]|nr:GntR family transcriptional regulator [Bacillota bacterium]
MLDFENYKQEQGVPIYLQLVSFIKRAVASGSAEDGEELPSRRYLSARLGINPNTVQKAFAALELEGLVDPVLVHIGQDVLPAAHHGYVL